MALIVEKHAQLVCRYIFFVLTTQRSDHVTSVDLTAEIMRHSKIIHRQTYVASHYIFTFCHVLLLVLLRHLAGDRSEFIIRATVDDYQRCEKMKMDSLIGKQVGIHEALRRIS